MSKDNAKKRNKFQTKNKNKKKERVEFEEERINRGPYSENNC